MDQPVLLPEVGEFQGLHITQPLDVLNQDNQSFAPAQTCISSTGPYNPGACRKWGKCISSSCALAPFKR